MSRSGYSDSCENWSLIRWRGAVSSAIRGQRGQAFLREMLAALDALPEKRLIAGDLVVTEEEAGYTGEAGCCAIGAVAIARGMNVDTVDPTERKEVAAAFGIAEALAAEIAFENDEACYRPETPEQRFARVRRWVVGHIALAGGGA